jgi:hypothetical protein
MTASISMPSAHQRLQLSVRSLVNPKTIIRCYKGLPVRETVALRLCEAARALHIPEPHYVLAVSPFKNV